MNKKYIVDNEPKDFTIMIHDQELNKITHEFTITDVVYISLNDKNTELILVKKGEIK